LCPESAGHNPLEPRGWRAALVTGPHVFNAREIYAEMLADAAAIEAADPAALARHIRGLLANPPSPAGSVRRRALTPAARARCWRLHGPD